MTDTHSTAPTPADDQAQRTDPEARLRELGHELPPPPKPVAMYLPALRVGDLVFVSGQIPMAGGELMAQGRVPTDIDPDMARRCAVQCTLNALAAVKAVTGSLDAVKRVVKLSCFVACEPGFHDQPQVANGASELLFNVFGEAGRHARAAVGSVDLPLGVPVEIEFIFEVE